MILVVESDSRTRAALEEALRPLPYDVAFSASGIEAIEMLSDESLGLVLLALELPVLDGLTVLETIERSERETGVVVLTADGSCEAAIESMKHGAAAVIQKPVSLEEVRSCVRRHFKGARPGP